MREITGPQYNHCIANLACSILSYYGVQPPNNTLPEADELLAKKYKNVVVLLLDGMGVSSIEKHLSPDGFFRRNLKATYSSTFPPTTVAATTAIDSGLFPNQSGWLGWTGYFPQIDRNIIYFWNIDNDTGEKIENQDVARTFVPYQSIRERIGETGIKPVYLAPIVEPFPNDFLQFTNLIREQCQADGRKYIYAYWDEPDHMMHDNGVEGEEIQKLLRDMEVQTEKLASELTDTLLIVTADHGHISIHNEVLTDYPEICECLVRMPSMEGRALNLFVKDGMKREFEKRFIQCFGNQFILMSKDDVLKKQLLGTGENHPELNRMLGDYLAVGTGDTVIVNTPSDHKGNHAGLTEAEMRIPLIAVSR